MRKRPSLIFQVDLFGKDVFVDCNTPSPDDFNSNDGSGKQTQRVSLIKKRFSLCFEKNFFEDTKVDDCDDSNTKDFLRKLSFLQSKRRLSQSFQDLFSLHSNEDNETGKQTEQNMAQSREVEKNRNSIENKNISLEGSHSSACEAVSAKESNPTTDVEGDTGTISFGFSEYNPDLDKSYPDRTNSGASEGTSESWVESEESRLVISSFLEAMKKTQDSQQQIYNWDRKMGLKKSHSKTMRNSRKSRAKIKEFLESDKTK